MRNRFARLARLKTMTPTSLLRLTLVLLVLVVFVMLGSGCKWPTFFSKTAPSGSRPTTPSPTTPATTLGRDAETAVTEYLTALSDHNYAAAYSLLSRDSQSAHAPADFEQQGKQGMPLYDLETAKTIEVRNNTALVEVRQLEDPATHGFQLVREDEHWKIVYRGGTPGVPWDEKGDANQ